MVRSLAVVVKGTAAEILHHLLLTKRRGKLPIRPWKVKLVALRSLESAGRSEGFGADGQRNQLLTAAAATGSSGGARRRASARRLLLELVE